MFWMRNMTSTSAAGTSTTSLRLPATARASSSTPAPRTRSTALSATVSCTSVTCSYHPIRVSWQMTHPSAATTSSGTTGDGPRLAAHDGAPPGLPQ
uniref:Uncharacterized protein n=1 Tax=Zea mays TaxID=4577 RepID=B4FPC8_MAIZE|nr:unknown [Zea mays]